MASDKQNDKPVKQQVASAKKTMAELYSDLPFLPYCEDRPRYRPLVGTVDHLRTRPLPNTLADLPVGNDSNKK